MLSKAKSGSMPAQQQGGAQNKLLDKVIAMNMLNYENQTDVNVVEKRSLIRYPAQRGEYNNGEVVEFRMSSSDAYTYGPNCYLTFVLQFVGGNNAERLYGETGILGAVKHSDLKSSSGAEILNETEIARKFAIEEDFKTEHTYAEKEDVSYYSSLFPQGGNAADPAGARFVIPLSMVCSLFKNEQLLPGLGLLSNSTLRLTLGTVAELLRVAGAATGYRIVRPEIYLDECQLTDTVQRRLNEISSRKGSGLSLVCKTWYSQSASVGAGVTQIEISMENSVSRACDVVGQVSLADGNANHYNSVGWDGNGGDLSGYIYRLGSMRFPDERVASAEVAYTNALIANGKFNKHDKPCMVTISDYAGPRNAVCTSLERSEIVNLSGYSVNTTRRLRLELNFTAGGAAPATAFMYLNYYRYINIHLDAISVKS